MEALTAVAAAGLALIDMVKAVDPAASIDDVGCCARRAARPACGPGRGPAVIRARVIVASNRAAAGVYADTSGPLLVAGLRELGCEVDEPVVVPDGEPVARRRCGRRVADGVDVVRHQRRHRHHPDRPHPGDDPGVLDYEIPGIAEAIRAHSRDEVPTAALSRGLAGVAGRTLIVNLPGSTRRRPGRPGRARADPRRTPSTSSAAATTRARHQARARSIGSAGDRRYRVTAAPTALGRRRAPLVLRGRPARPRCAGRRRRSPRPTA